MNPVNPNVTRAATILELATGLVGRDVSVPRQVCITLDGKAAATRLVLNSASTIDSIAAVVDGRTDVGIVNPAAALMQAFRGIGAFDAKRPVRTLAVLPSHDQLVFAVHAGVAGDTLDDIATSGLPLRVSVRANPVHGIHDILNHALSCIGCDYHSIRASGGKVLFDGASPGAASANLQRLTERNIDAIFDEGADEWLEAASSTGARIVGFREDTMATLERAGYRRAWLRRGQYPSLANDVLTIDFSGWPIFVRADLPDEMVVRLCQALELRIGHIPWSGSEPLDIASVCRDTAATPIMAPFHPAAAQYWRDQGYL